MVWVQGLEQIAINNIIKTVQRYTEIQNHKNELLLVFILDSVNNTHCGRHLLVTLASKQ